MKSWLYHCILGIYCAISIRALAVDNQPELSSLDEATSRKVELPSSKHIPVNQFKCPTTGYFLDPKDNSTYYRCVSVKGTLTSHTFFCPRDQCYDSQSLTYCSASGCIQSVPTTDYECLRENLRQDAQLICQDETISILEHDLEKIVAAAATRGDPFNNLRLSLRDVHLNMRENYGKLIQNVGQNIYPLIVATDSDTPDLAGTGGTYKLYFRNGTMRRLAPVGPEFEIYKCLSHMVLGVYSIVAPYFLSSESTNWEPALRTFQQKVKDVVHLLPKSGIGKEKIEHAKTMLKMTDDYIATALKTHSVNVKKFHQFASELAPYIDKSMNIAAKAHASATIPALQKWKEELGTEWKEVYVVIPTVWPVSLYNIRLQMLEKVMDFKQIKSQVLIVEGARNEDDARTTLGRVVNDRALALLVFGGSEDENMRDHLFSLSTRRDLLSTAEAKQVNDFCQADADKDKPRCPMARKYATILRT